MVVPDKPMLHEFILPLLTRSFNEPPIPITHATWIVIHQPKMLAPKVDRANTGSWKMP